MRRIFLRLYLIMHGVHVHSDARVNTRKIGKRSSIWAFVNIMNGVQIGENCNICDRCFLESGVTVGDNVTIKTGVSLWSGLVIEDNVFVGPGVQFCNDKMPRSKQYTKHMVTRLHEGCSIGSGSVILPGIIIGNNAMIGAGSVVTKNIPPNSIAFGNPCKVQRSL